MSENRKTLLAVIGAGGTALLLVFVVLPALFAPDRAPGFGPISAEKARHDVRTSALQLIGGVVLALGAVFTARTVRLTRESNAMQRESHITDRYASAVELLGHDHESVRLGGVYALERIAVDSPTRDHQTIMDLLSAHARSYGRGDAWGRPAEPDVEAAVIVLGRRDSSRDHQRFTPILDAVGLSGARLRELQLDKARLRGANLSGALMDGASLREARLHKARLVDSWLTGVDLRGADMTDAHLEMPHLANAKYNERTKWPDGFDPAAAGATLEREPSVPTAPGA